MPDLDQFDLNDREEELVEKYFEMKDNDDFKQKHLADELELGDSTVSAKLKEMEERGIIPPREG
jgi:Mn-dependent DtxR family transcriptional regulator